MMVFKLLVMIFSLWGTMKFVQTLTKFEESLSWIFSFLSMILVLYAGGVLGLLKWASYTLYGLGIASGLYHGWRWLVSSIKWKGWQLRIVTCLVILALLLPLLATKLQHYDNFSHWALVVKYLWTTHQFPDAHQQIVSFISYPLGSSLFIYHFAFHTAFHEGILLVAQGILYVSSLLAGYALIDHSKKTAPLGYAGILLTLPLMLVIARNIPFQSLLVDLILSTIPLALAVGLWRYQDDLWRASVFLGVGLGAYSMIKNSALFFTVILLVAYVIIFLKEKSYRTWKSLMIMVMTAVVSFSGTLSWHYWLHRRFTDLSDSKHSMDLASYQENINEKTPEVIAQIKEAFLHYFENISNPTLVIFLGLLLIYLVLIGVFWFKKQEGCRRLLGIFASLTMLYGLYLYGLYNMYLYSMPIEEALRLAAISRYIQTIHVFIVGILIGSLLIHIQEHGSQDWSRWFLGVSVIFVLFFNKSVRDLGHHAYTSSQGGAQDLARQVSKDFGINQEKVLVITSPERQGFPSYYEHAGIYYLMTPHVDSLQRFDNYSDNEFKALVESYDHIYLLDEDSEFQERYVKVFGHPFQN